MRLLQSLTRGLETLDYLRHQGKPCRLTDIAAALGVDKSNASHIVKTLVAAGYAKQDESRRYGLTDKVIGNRTAVHTLEDIVKCKETWRPALAWLVAQTRECAHLAVLVKNRVWYIDKIDSNLPLKVDHPVGSLSPLHCTALGKAFLAFGHVEADKTLTRYTPATITTTSALLAEIEATRIRGYAIDDEEFETGIRCVARPIYDSRGRIIAALGVSGPSVRIDDQRLETLGQMVMAATSESLKQVMA